MKLLIISSIFKQKKAKRSNINGANSWKWKPFKHLKALSTFYVRAKMMVKVNNPNFVLATSHHHHHTAAMQLDPSWSQSCCAFSSVSSSAGGPHKGAAKSGEVLLEGAVQAIRTKRLFFDPGSTNSNILGSARFVFQDCVVQAIETSNPYVEFRVSMEEMVAAYGLIKSGSNGGGERAYYWDYLEGLLSWYLRMNEKKNHGVIVEAFIDMYTAIPACPSSCSFSYNASASSSKSKEWWEIKINETYLRAEKEICPK